MKKYAIILAAGKGTRMKTTLPKCIVNLYNKPMISYIVDECEKCNFDSIVVVVGYKKELVMNVLRSKVNYVIQKEQLGTANAVLSCKSFFNNKDGICVIIPGDMPLINYKIIQELINNHQLLNNDMTIVSTIFDKVNDYGRIIKNKNQVINIVESSEATNKQKEIKEINSGLYCINTKLLFHNLNKINNNNKSKEFFITDLVPILSSNYKVRTLLIPNNFNLIGINDLNTLKEIEAYILITNIVKSINN